MNDQWQELKETILEMRDNDGTCTQREVCKFLANLMDILEKQNMQKQKPILDKVKVKINSEEKWLAQAGYGEYNVNIAFNSIKHTLKEMERE